MSSSSSPFALPLNDRVVVVTGAGRGIGRSVVENVLQRGGKVAAFDIVIDDNMKQFVESQSSDLTSGDGDTSSSSSKVIAVVCDVTNEQSVIEGFEKTVAHFGRIDSIVNNAGVILEKPLGETTMEDFDRTIAVNLRGPFLCAKIAVTYFQKQPDNPPRIVNIASEIGHSGMKHYAAYTASKGGIYSMTRSLALELAPDVLVNNVAPGPTDTPMLQSEEGYPEWKKGEGIPMARIGQPSDVARAVCFLLGPDSVFITGSTVDVNGGAVMY